MEFQENPNPKVVEAIKRRLEEGECHCGLYLSKEKKD